MGNLYTKTITIIGILTIAITAPFVTTYMLVATFNFFLLLFGLSFLKTDKKIHAKIMATAILSDLSIVLFLQIQRNAIQTALFAQLSYLNRAHIYCSSTATLLYFPMFFLGLKLYRQLNQTKSSTKLKKWHKRLGAVTLLFRGAGFLLMYSL